jgi:hypothetical protein
MQLWSSWDERRIMKAAPGQMPGSMLDILHDKIHQCLLMYQSGSAIGIDLPSVETCVHHEEPHRPEGMQCLKPITASSI